MDELEDDLRTALGHLADGPEPSDDLVGRTLVRSIRLRRRRNALAASGVAAAVLAVTLVVATVAGGDPKGAQFQVTDPSSGDAVATSTSVVTTTTIATPTTPPTTRRQTAAHPSHPLPTPTTGPACAAPNEVDVTGGVIFEPEPNGDVTVVVSLPFGPGAILSSFRLDDGTTGSGGFRKTYAPADFGRHWYELSSTDVDHPGCTAERYVFDVSAASVTTTTIGSTTTSVPSEPTTEPDTTTTVG